MSETNHQRPNDAAEQQAFETAIRNNLSPEGVVAVIAFLSTASITHPDNDEHRKAIEELRWFRDRLLEMVGVEEYNRLLDELGL